MPTSPERLNEGVDYTVTINHESDTDGEMLTAVLHEKVGSNSWTVGTANGDDPNTDIDIVLDLSDRSPGSYILEVWSDLGGVNQELIVPDENDVELIEIVDRKEV